MLTEEKPGSGSAPAAVEGARGSESASDPSRAMCWLRADGRDSSVRSCHAAGARGLPFPVSTAWRLGLRCAVEAAEVQS